MGLKDLMSRMMRDEEDDELEETTEREESMDFVSKASENARAEEPVQKKEQQGGQYPCDGAAAGRSREAGAL